MTKMAAMPVYGKISGKIVTNVGSTCGLTLLLLHLYVKDAKEIKYVYIRKLSSADNLGKQF